MVDLAGQHQKIEAEILQAFKDVVHNSDFINGNPVKEFSSALASFLNIPHVIPCANGTDALQVALMALDLQPGDEIIIPAFNYVSAAEVAALLRLKIVFCDVDPLTFNVTAQNLYTKISPQTKAIVVVHLFGQSAEMSEILTLVREKNIFLIEDVAQSLGVVYEKTPGSGKMTGSFGHVGITSFFPSKNLGCLGDGGALFTNDSQLAHKITMICNHGQEKKYYYKKVGVNSRLDTLQAAILNIKLKYLPEYLVARQKAAAVYDELLRGQEIIIPEKPGTSGHVYNQYTIRVPEQKRDKLKEYMSSKGIPTMIYYPMPLHLQEAYSQYKNGELPVSEKLSYQVLSLPLHTELDREQQVFICENLLLGLKNF
jgi:dTDP-4-amino-4,6-dideoxygalactose transaminase